MNLVAAGVVLGGNEHQARASWLRLRIASEGLQDADDSDIGGENSEADGCEDGQEQNDGHKKRDHDQPTFTKLLDCRGFRSGSAIPQFILH